MVNLPPDQNERRDRDQILSFDELLAVVLALLGVGTILWWSTSRSDNWLADDTPLGQLSNSLLLNQDDRDQGLAAESTDEFEPLSLENFTRRDTQTTPPINEDDGGLPSLFGTSREAGAAATGIAAGAGISELEPTEMEPSEIAPSEIVTEPAIEEPQVEEPTATAPPPLDISDVPEDHWAYPFIQDMYEQGYLPDFPSGQFQPDKELTRAELASLLNESFVDDPVERDPLDFADVASDYWAAGAIDQAVERGFMSGYPDNEFRPDQLVPRYEVLVSLAAGLDLANPDNIDQLLQGLGDLQALPDWARPKVAASAQEGLVVNYPEPTQLNPGEPATRAEIVAMMHQALVAEGKLDPIESEYVVKPE